MLGFAVVISKNKEGVEQSFCWKTPFDFQAEHIVRNKSFMQVFVEQNTAKRFIDEKLWIETDNFFIVTEGVITNLQLLFTKYSVSTYEELISKIYTQSRFFKEFTGNFAGYMFLKKENKHILFNNHSGTKKVFYFENDCYCIFSTDLFTLVKKLDELNIAKSLNVEAAYLLLTHGCMYENLTLVHEVKQLRAGEYLSMENNCSATKDFYFHLNNIAETTDNEGDIIENLDKKFKRAINLEYNQDERHGFTSVSTLSGGLDSRMTTLVALHNQISTIQCICFSEENYADEIIAREITQTYNLPLHMWHLSAYGLMAIDDVVKVNDGLTLYSGASHAFEALCNYTVPNVGLLHTGTIGDRIMGSFSQFKPKKHNELHAELWKKATFITNRYKDDYANEELYLMYNYAFAAENNGFLFYDVFGESSSPFLEPDFMSYALSIPQKLRYGRRIYVEWIRKKYPDAANFTWETIGGKPTNNEILLCYYRYKRAMEKRLPFTHSMWKKGMNPEQLWYDTTPEVQKYVDNYFEEHIHKLEKYAELQTDAIVLYKTGGIIEKTQVLTLLAALKLLFE
ncbi:MAG: hypothetical protein LBM68_01275 [Bacteroidales bacterium]|jgi:asparagine synthase (glutamine-hydrolysing)|nr:hypothetical protein [Bacteroidales bacterium]